MNRLIALVLALLAMLLMAPLRLIALFRRERIHEPLEYYAGWTGYWDPIRLEGKISKDEADAIAARGNAYLIGHFGADNRLARAVKMYRGKVFFDCVYEYYAGGRLKRARITNPQGLVTVKDYDERGRRIRHQ